jgi:hypothetical protein
VSYEVGDTYPTQITIRDEDGALADPGSRTLRVRLPTGALMSSAAAEALIVHPSTGIYRAGVPLSVAGMWVIGWTATDPAQFGEVQLWVRPALSPLFCTPADIATRLGREGALTAAETPMVEMLCELATDTIMAAIDKTEAWRAAITDVPRIVRVVAIELVTRGMANPTGVGSITETLGAYSYTTRYTVQAQANAAGLMLSPAEERLVRRAVFGTLSATTVPHTLTFDPDPEVVSDV